MNDIMAEFCAEHLKATYDTAEEIIRRLEEERNYIPDSDSVRREYAYALMREYRKYIEDRSGTGQ